jgi:hypothetical protein
MSGAHAARKGRRATDPDLRPPPDDQHEGWAQDVYADGWTGPLPEPPAPASEAPTDPGTLPLAAPAATAPEPEPVTVPDAPEVIAPAGPIRAHPDSVALDRKIAGVLAEAARLLSVAASERVQRQKDDIRDRGQAALVKYANALPALPRAMTAATERPEEQM